MFSLATDWDRTGDLTLTMGALYLLSYRGINFFIKVKILYLLDKKFQVIIFIHFHRIPPLPHLLYTILNKTEGEISSKRTEIG